MKRGMDAVIGKAERAMEGKRSPMLKRKSGPSLMIAIGKPAPPMADKGGKGKDADVCPECGYAHSKREQRGEDLSKSDKVAALEEKIASLKAELALLEDEDEMDDDEMDDDEDEDEY